MSDRKWVDELIADMRERDAREARQHHRLLLLEEQGPIFFEQLQVEVKAGLSALQKHVAAFKGAALESAASGRTFILRTYDSRPMVKAEVHLHTVGLVVKVESRERATDVYVGGRTYQIGFGIDANSALSLCMECQSLTIEDVAKLILTACVGGA